ncbi:RelA/SpoT domain-containing protein [Solirubrobacter phytolaccae]|uniref:RelA/SpoT domain-containing protein n=1 Tax=Solirubrobacter phytolaccae TaxID=1404360 RepID=A0A9X3SIB1_9ACTN|nr:RelA/SpoT domain-containing protein [Solirubrobacter phytolaccae]MDA0184112.1 RelA/SpoT domain-containing protein [Solirubrobacter phytolaccae]
MDRAGKAMRQWLADGSGPIEDEVLIQGLWDLFGWREGFQRPLSKVANGLRSFVKSECGLVAGERPPVGQRLKRVPQIITKLGRYPGMKLSRMQDIGGCRAILSNSAEVAGVRARIEHRWQVLGEVHDYTVNPQPSGYRAVHINVMRDNHRIEIQLRTPRQHEWATVVERTGLRLRMPLKEGGGDANLLRYFELAARGLALEESGQQPDKGFLDDFAEARERVRHFFRYPTGEATE